MRSREDHIKRASWISICGNALLSVIKIAAGIVSGSLAVLADGIDSATDIAGSVVTLIAARVMSKPPDIRYPYGYIKADSLATKVLSFFIFFAGAQLAIATIKGLIAGEMREIPTMLAIYVTLISIAGKVLLTLYQHKMGKKHHSPMLIANSKNMRNDVVTSLSVLIGLLFTQGLKLPVLDPIIALAVSLWIMYTAFRLFIENSTELLDGVDNPRVYQQVFDAISRVEGALNPHRVRIRKMGIYFLVSVDIEVKGGISVNASHRIADQVEKNIKKELVHVYDVLVHVEPAGMDHEVEKFGVSRKDL